MSLQLNHLLNTLKYTKTRDYQISSVLFGPENVVVFLFVLLHLQVVNHIWIDKMVSRKES